VGGCGRWGLPEFALHFREISPGNLINSWPGRFHNQRPLGSGSAHMLEKTKSKMVPDRAEDFLLVESIYLGQIYFNFLLSFSSFITIGTYCSVDVPICCEIAFTVQICTVFYLPYLLAFLGGRQDVFPFIIYLIFYVLCSNACTEWKCFPRDILRQKLIKDHLKRSHNIVLIE
jgi:hypothetical protein